MRDRPLRVVLADDHPVFREGLRGLLDGVASIVVVATADDGAAAARLAVEMLADVVVMDLHMAGVNGIEGTRRVVATAPSAAVLMLTMFEDDESVFAALRAGARGYVLKEAQRDEIVRAIESVGDGDAVFGQRIATRIVSHFSQRSAPPAFPELSDRERQVLALLADGQTNALIARRLGITSKTVRNHVSTVFSKLQVSDRVEAAERARQAGLRAQR